MRRAGAEAEGESLAEVGTSDGVGWAGNDTCYRYMNVFYSFIRGMRA
jgi:hypothetical protein